MQNDIQINQSVFKNFSLEDWKYFLSFDNFLEKNIKTYELLKIEDNLSNIDCVSLSEKPYITFCRTSQFSLLDFNHLEIEKFFKIKPSSFFSQQKHIQILLKHMSKNINFKNYINNLYYFDNIDPDFMESLDNYSSLFHHFYYIFTSPEKNKHYQIIYEYCDGGNNEKFFHIINKSFKISNNPNFSWYRSWIPAELERILSIIKEQKELGSHNTTDVKVIKIL